jgi:hypothetical protein
MHMQIGTLGEIDEEGMESERPFQDCRLICPGSAGLGEGSLSRQHEGDEDGEAE